MSSTGLDVFDETLHKTNAWLKEIGETLLVVAMPIRHCARCCLAYATA